MSVCLLVLFLRHSFGECKTLSVYDYGVFSGECIDSLTVQSDRLITKYFVIDYEYVLYC